MINEKYFVSNRLKQIRVQIGYLSNDQPYHGPWKLFLVHAKLENFCLLHGCYTSLLPFRRKSVTQWCGCYSGAPAARRAAKRSPIVIWERKGNPWVDFLMVIMASGIARGRVRTTTTTTTTATATATATAELPNMAAILQIIGWQRHAAVVYRVLPWYWTSMLWSYDSCQYKVSADQYHVTISRAQVYSSSR